MGEPSIPETVELFHNSRTIWVSAQPELIGYGIDTVHEVDCLSGAVHFKPPGRSWLNRFKLKGT